MKHGQESYSEFKKKVVVIMPFGGSKPDQERQCIFDFMRIKHLIEKKVKVSASEPNGRIHYDVSVCRAYVGEISRQAVREIAEADIVVALLTKTNVNVAYELAIRNLFKPEYLMIIRGEPKDVLPVYLRDMAYIKFDRSDADGQAIEEHIAQLTEQEFPNVHWDDRNIPESLEQAIEKHDRTLGEDLQNAFSRLEHAPPSWPEHMIDLAEVMHPGGLLKGWKCYNPTSLVRLKWRKKTSKLEYAPEDMIDEPVILDANENFARLYDFSQHDFSQQELPDPDGHGPLTVERLLSRIEEYVEPKHMERLIEDQKRVAQKLIFEDRDGAALVPLEFNGRHPHFPNKTFLPSMIGKRTIGDTNKPHTTYLVIAYIEDFWPIDHPDSPVNQGNRS